MNNAKIYPKTGKIGVSLLPPSVTKFVTKTMKKR